MPDLKITELDDGVVAENDDQLAIARSGNANFFLTIEGIGLRFDTRYAPLTHVSDTNNPHAVTAAQVGAYTTIQSDSLFASSGMDVLTQNEDVLTRRAGVYARIPVGVEGDVLGLAAGPTIAWIDSTTLSYAPLSHVGAIGLAEHGKFTTSEAGFVPAPIAGSGTRVLQEDGNWVENSTGGGGGTLTTIRTAVSYAIPGAVAAGDRVPFFIPTVAGQATTIVEAIFELESTAGNTATFQLRTGAKGAETPLSFVTAGGTNLVADEAAQNDQVGTPPTVGNRTRGDITVVSVVGSPTGLSVAFVLEHALTVV